MLIEWQVYAPSQEGPEGCTLSSTKLTVEVSGMCREDAVRAAAGDVARIFPNSNNEKYGEPRQM